MTQVEKAPLPLSELDNRENKVRPLLPILKISAAVAALFAAGVGTRELIETHNRVAARQEACDYALYLNRRAVRVAQFESFGPENTERFGFALVAIEDACKSPDEPLP